MELLRALHRELCGLVDLLLPPACPLCGAVLDLESSRPARPAFCDTCLAGITPLSTPRCPICVLPFATAGGADHLCAGCLRRAPAFERAGAVGLYAGTLRRALHRLKYQGAINLDRPLGDLMAETLLPLRNSFRPDLLIPVPLHDARLRQRTYNQSLLLARVLGRRWGLPVEAAALVRVREAALQQTLRLAERQGNLRGVFALRRKVTGCRVLLIDDVMTTGATSRECARVLTEAGAKAVAVAVVGRVARHF